MNLKEQVSGAIAQKMSSEIKKNPFAALALGLGSKLGDTLVDSMVTPVGVMKLMSGQKIADAVQKSNENQSLNAQVPKELLPNARYSYDNLSQFSVWIKGNADEEIRFVLVRDGVDWKLTNIIIPMKL
jgi:hypothetical protein